MVLKKYFLEENSLEGLELPLCILLYSCFVRLRSQLCMLWKMKKKSKYYF